MKHFILKRIGFFGATFMFQIKLLKDGNVHPKKKKEKRNMSSFPQFIQYIGWSTLISTFHRVLSWPCVSQIGWLNTL
jgi:hypothetical protein